MFRQGQVSESTVSDATIEDFKNHSNSDLNTSEENQTRTTYTASSEASSEGESYEIIDDSADENPLGLETNYTETPSDLEKSIDYPSSLSNSASELTSSSDSTSEYSTTDTSGYSSTESSSSESSDSESSEEFAQEFVSVMETMSASINHTMLPILAHLIESLDNLSHLKMHLENSNTGHERELLDNAILHTQLAKIRVKAEIPQKISVSRVSIFALPIVVKNEEASKENVENLTFTPR